MNLKHITLGNAMTDGASFHSWFIGDLEKWGCGNVPPLSASDLGLRQSRAVEIKWGEHRAGERRTEWASCSDKTTMSILLRGKFLLRFRSPQNREAIVERRLERESDYAVWGTEVEHTWVVEEDSVILTVRWREQP